MGLFKKKPEPDDEPNGTTSAPAPAAVGGLAELGEMQRQAAQISAHMRGKPLSAENLQELVKAARGMQADGLARMQAVQQAPEGGTAGSLLSALGMDWSSDYIKRVDCPSCGAPKKTASPSAYIYCDYCGALADFDFRAACADPALKMPGPEYRTLVNAAHPRLQAAKAAGDRDQYLAIQREVFDGYATNVPKACSHRITDPDYRAKYVEYMAETSVVCDFDAQFSALNDEMLAAVRSLAWTGGMTSPKTGGPTFWAMVEVVTRQRSRAGDLMAEAGLSGLDPDHASEEVRERMTSSLFCQGWLPMLEGEDAQRLVKEMNLAGEYTRIQPIADGETRSCGGCGGALTVLPGAKRVICNHCGRALDVGGAQSTCQGCGGHLTFPVGVSRLQCPFCRSENERVGLI